MYHYWKNNKNVVLTAAALFIVSLTGLLFFLTEAPVDEGNKHSELTADVVDSMDVNHHQEKEIEYRNMLGYHDGPLVVLGVDGLIDFVSWNYEESSGYKGEAIMNKLYYSYVHPDDLSMFIGAFGRVLASESQETMIGPYRIQGAEGEYSLHMASFYPIKEDEKVVKIAIEIKDITEKVEGTNLVEEEEVIEENTEVSNVEISNTEEENVEEDSIHEENIEEVDEETVKETETKLDDSWKNDIADKSINSEVLEETIEETVTEIMGEKTSKAIEEVKINQREDNNNGHGNDEDHFDEANPGNSHDATKSKETKEEKVKKNPKLLTMRFDFVETLAEFIR